MCFKKYHNTKQSVLLKEMLLCCMCVCVCVCVCERARVHTHARARWVSEYGFHITEGSFKILHLEKSCISEAFSFNGLILILVFHLIQGIQGISINFLLDWIWLD